MNIIEQIVENEDRYAKSVSVWVASIGSLIALDLYYNRKRADSTLSSVTRRTFHTDTKLGKGAFLASWATLTAWFIPHILNHSEHELPPLIKESGINL